MKHITPASLRSALATVVLTAAFPTATNAQYCPPDVFANGVEPICWLAFANVDNPSDPTTEAESHEDFTAITAELVRGATYTIRFTGYTGGTPPNHVAANFDWDRDEEFEAHVEIGRITGDECQDTLSGTFTVPEDAALGTSRVRFVKTFSYNAADDACNWFSGFGQSEDYTINVSAGGIGIAELEAAQFTLHPNPSNGDMTLVNSGSGAITELRIVDPAGRTVYSDRLNLAPGTRHDLRLAGRLAPGTYMAMLHNNGIQSTVRCVIH